MEKHRHSHGSPLARKAMLGRSGHVSKMPPGSALPIKAGGPGVYVVGAEIGDAPRVTLVRMGTRTQGGGFVEVASPGGKVEEFIAKDDGQAAKAHLAAGRPVFFVDPKVSGGLVRAFPDGTKQVVEIKNGQVVVVKQI